VNFSYFDIYLYSCHRHAAIDAAIAAWCCYEHYFNTAPHLSLVVGVIAT